MEAKPHILNGSPALGWVFRNQHPVGSQGRHRCRVGNLPEAGRLSGRFPKPCDRRGVDFGRDGSERYVGAFPGRDLRCTEERGSGCLSRARVVCARKTVIPRTNNIDVHT